MAMLANKCNTRKTMKHLKRIMKTTGMAMLANKCNTRKTMMHYVTESSHLLSSSSPAACPSYSHLGHGSSSETLNEADQRAARGRTTHRAACMEQWCDAICRKHLGACVLHGKCWTYRSKRRTGCQPAHLEASCTCHWKVCDAIHALFLEHPKLTWRLSDTVWHCHCQCRKNQPLPLHAECWGEQLLKHCEDWFRWHKMRPCART